MEKQTVFNRIIACVIVCFLTVCFFDISLPGESNDFSGQTASNEASFHEIKENMAFVVFADNVSYFTKNAVAERGSKRTKESKGKNVFAFKGSPCVNLYIVALAEPVFDAFDIFFNQRFIIGYIHNQDGRKR